MCARIGVDPLACKLSNIDFNYDEFSYSPLQLVKVSEHKCWVLVISTMKLVFDIYLLLFLDYLHSLV